MALSWGIVIAWALATASAWAVDAAETRASDDWHELLKNGQLVEIHKFVPGILIEMRYAGSNNILGHPLYAPEMPCMTRPQVARQLQEVEAILAPQGYRLKVWDAYRPPEAQRAIWHQFSARHYVADPGDGRGSLHSWGLAVDVTLVDKDGHELSMPSLFDTFTAAASGIYHGDDVRVYQHLRALQRAMKAAGFIGLSTEWWHFAARNWQLYEPLAW